MPEKLEPITTEKLYPKYKVKQKEALAWIFTSLMKIDLNPPKLTLTHSNKAFLHRFTQLARLGKVRRKILNLNTVTWECSDPREIAFLLTQIKTHIHTKRENNIAKLLIKQIEKKPDPKTERKLENLIKAHNIYFYYFQILC